MTLKPLDLETNLTLVVALVASFAALVAAQDIIPLLEPSRVFSCYVEGKDYYPEYIAFSSDGNLHSSDVQLPLREPMHSERSSGTPDHSQADGHIYRHTDNGCEAVFGLEQPVSVFGMSEYEGEVCFAWHLNEGFENSLKDKTERFAKVSCLSKDKKLRLAHTSTTQVALLGFRV